MSLMSARLDGIADSLTFFALEEELRHTKLALYIFPHCSHVTTHKRYFTIYWLIASLPLMCFLD